jgi:hypothetical protein
MSNPSFAGHAIPWEAVCTLGGAVGRDVWVNIPHWADAAYIAQVVQVRV